MHILYHEARFKEYFNKLLHHMFVFFFIFYTSPYSELWVLSCLPSLEFIFFWRGFMCGYPLGSVKVLASDRTVHI